MKLEMIFCLIAIFTHFMPIEVMGDEIYTWKYSLDKIGLNTNDYINEIFRDCEFSYGGWLVAI